MTDQLIVAPSQPAVGVFLVRLRVLLIEVAERADTLGVEFVLVASRRPVRRVLALTGLDESLVITADPFSPAAMAVAS